mgnify:CR=1 FL=1
MSNTELTYKKKTVYEKASDWYGNPLPLNIEERIAKELYGDIGSSLTTARPSVSL